MTETAPDTLLLLATKCEEASYGDRELDADIFIAFTPECRDAGRIDREGGVVGWWPRDGAYVSAREVPRYTASLDAAVGLCTRVLPGWGWVAGGGGEHGTRGDASLLSPKPDGRDIIRIQAATPALALIAATLRAKSTA